MQTADGYTFQLSRNVTRHKVTFTNRFGIDLVGDLYLPDNLTEKRAALVVSGPFGAVKEQSSGLYADELARRGFITLAFDNSFTGESGGKARNIASPEIFTEDFSAAVDYLTTRKEVDTDKIAAMAICGLSGMAITAMTVDPRIKAVATSSMYDMSNSIGCGYMNSYTQNDKDTILNYIAEERTRVAQTNQTHVGPHEISFDDKGNILKNERLLPNADEVVESMHNPVFDSFFDYYKTERGYAKRSINSNTAWDSRTPYSFFAFPLYTHLENLGKRRILLLAGEKAHSRYHSEQVANLTKNAELVIVPGADHCDLYDKKELIPFDKLEHFFKTELK